MNASTLRGLAGLALFASALPLHAVTLLSDGRSVSIVDNSVVQSAAPAAPFSNLSSILSTDGLVISQVSSIGAHLLQSKSQFYAEEHPNRPERSATGKSVFDVNFQIHAPTAYELVGYREVWLWGTNDLTFTGPSGIIVHATGGTGLVPNDNFPSSSGILQPGVYNLNLTSLVTISEGIATTSFDSTPGKNEVTLRLHTIPDAITPISTFVLMLGCVVGIYLVKQRSGWRIRL
jgi:hypothetical protein